MKYMRIIVDLMCVTAIFLGCQKKPSNPIIADQAPAAETTTTASTSNTAAGGATSSTSSSTLPGLGVLTGALVLEENNIQEPAANATVKIASHPEYSATADANGNFSIANILPGTLTIYAEGNTPGAKLRLANTASLRAAQFRDIVVAAGKSTALPTDTVLTKPGSLSGTVILLNNPQNIELVGISVYVPGTSFAAKTDAQGNFTMTGVPAGIYTLRFEKQGLTSSQLDDITVVSDENTALSSIYMSLSTGPSGQIVAIENTSAVQIGTTSMAVLTGNSVTVDMLYDTRAVLMKVAHESAFINVDWMPVAKTFTFTAANNPSAFAAFATDGAKDIYVKFADQNGLESSVYHKAFIIDNDSPTLSSIKILNGWAQSATRTILIDIVGTDSGTGIKEIMLSNSTDFSLSLWQPYSSIGISWTLGPSSGNATVYAKIRDYKSRESVVVSDSINVGAYTLITNTTYADKVYLHKEQSPFRFADSVTFDGDLEIEDGTTVNIDGSRTLTVKGVFTAKGTQPNGITIQVTGAAAGSCGMMGGGSGTLDLSQALPGVSAHNDVEYVRFNFLNSIIVNGGQFLHDNFDASLCTSGTTGQITKVGLDNLVIASSTFNKWRVGLNAQDGDTNSTFSQNSGSLASGVIQSNAATNTVVTNNALTSIYDSHASPLGLLGFLNDNPMTYSGNTFAGNGTVIVVGSRSTDLTISNLTVTGCGTIASTSNLGGSTVVTIQNSSITGCSYALDPVSGSIDSAGSTKALKFVHNNITVSKALVLGAYSDGQMPTEFDNNNIVVNCGLTAGTYCDLFYYSGYTYNGGAACMATDYMNTVLTGNNIYCMGNTTAGCRGITLTLGPSNSAEQGSESMTACGFRASDMTLSLNGNYWSSSSGSKGLVDPNLNNGQVTANSYKASQNDALSLDAAIRVYKVMNTVANIISFTGSWPTITTTTLNASAGPQ